MQIIAVKDIYEQVDKYEYNRINPYERMRATIRCNHPNAKINFAKTISCVIGGLSFPALIMDYSID